MCQINACERTANRESHLRETRLVLKLYYTVALCTVQDRTQDRTGQDRMEIGLEGHRMPQDTGWTRALYVKSQDKQTTKNFGLASLAIVFSILGLDFLGFHCR